MGNIGDFVVNHSVTLRDNSPLSEEEFKDLGKEFLVYIKTISSGVTDDYYIIYSGDGKELTRETNCDDVVFWLDRYGKLTVPVH